MSDVQLKSFFRLCKRRKYLYFPLFLLLYAVLVVGFLYLDRRYALSLSIQRFGLWGYVIAVLIMALLYMTPIPSEGLLVLCFKIYGIYMGIFLSWTGMAMSSIITFLIAKLYGQKLVQKVVSPKNFTMVDSWVERKGTLGLFIARLLPIPAFAINCIAGVIPSIKFWPYFWTAAVSILPYYVVTALVFLGIYSGSWRWLMLGGFAVVVFWAAGYGLKRR